MASKGTADLPTTVPDTDIGLKAGPHPSGLTRVALRYWIHIFPEAQRQLRRWRDRALAIPNEMLRQQALASLEIKGQHPEGAAIFAAFAPALRAEAVQFLVAYQIIFDYVDTLSEAEGAGENGLQNSRQLHLALIDALNPDTQPADYYAHHPHSDDGGYLADLVTTCHRYFKLMPSYDVVRERVQRLGVLLGDVQSICHASSNSRVELLQQWVKEQTWSRHNLSWWEICSVASSTLAIFALLSLGTHPETTLEDAEEVEAAYVPWICGLNTLLDNFVDQSEDAASGHCNYVSHYRSTDEAAKRIQTLAERALAAARGLPDASVHVWAVSGLIAMYISSPKIRRQGFQEPARRLLKTSGAPGRIVYSLLRVRSLFSTKSE